MAGNITMLLLHLLNTIVIYNYKLTTVKQLHRKDLHCKSELNKHYLQRKHFIFKMKKNIKG